MVISKMQSLDFWNMGTHDKNMILDGEEWIFEAVINGRYHFITRNSPDVYDGKEYAELCNLIVQITSVRLKKINRATPLINKGN